MKAKSLLLIPAAIALGTSAHAYTNFGFRLNLGLPLFYPVYSAPAYPTTVVYQAPPGAAAEQATPAPGPGYVWMAGHWSNSNGNWVWVVGHWELPPSRTSVWSAGHWARGANGGWVWVDGAWSETAQPPPQPPSTPPGAPASAPAAPTASVPPQAPAMVPQPSTPPPPVGDVPEGVMVGNEPPSPIVEYVPPAPYPDYVWVGGFWGWNGAWYWNAGRYVRPPFRGAVWIGGSWGHGTRGWGWHGGHWR